MTARVPLVVITGRKQELPATDVIAPSSLGTGTPDATTLLRGDSTWVEPITFGGLLAFSARHG